MGQVIIENIVPILRVVNLTSGLEHYTRVLGFAEQWRAGDTAGIARGGHGLMLTDAEQGPLGAWVWVGVKDLDALHTEYTASGAGIILQPTECPWAREFRVQDPDGNVLRLAGAPGGDDDSADS